MLKGWTKAAQKFSGFPAAARQTFRAAYDVMLNLSKVLDEAGVPMLAGADPVESVDHLHRIRGVVRGGRYLGPADLDALKEKVAATRSAR